MDFYLQKLRGLTSSGFQQKLLDASLNILKQENNPLKINNFACSIRELSRHILGTLAPDNKIKECDWFEQQYNNENVPIIIRRQRIQYAIQKKLPTSYVSKHIPNFVDLIKNVNDTINNLSKYTHIEENIFGISPEDEENLAVEILDSFIKFKETIDCSTKRFNEDIEKSIDVALYNYVCMQYIEQLDKIASHYQVNDISFYDFNVSKINEEHWDLRVFGDIDTTLQWGSDGDYRRGDGLKENINIGFDADLRVKVNERFPNTAYVLGLNIDEDQFYD